MSAPYASGLLEPFGHGRGYPDWLFPANPAAGQNLAVVVEGRNWVRVLGAIATINTDANAANRFVSLDFLSARGVTYLRNAAGLVLTANTVNQVFAWTEQRTDAQWATNTPILVPVSSIFVAPASTIQITIDNKQVGDTITAVALTIERFDTGPGGYPIGFTPYALGSDHEGVAASRLETKVAEDLAFPPGT